MNHEVALFDGVEDGLDRFVGRVAEQGVHGWHPGVEAKTIESWKPV
jgi:hypothetical protein